MKRVECDFTYKLGYGRVLITLKPPDNNGLIRLIVGRRKFYKQKSSSDHFTKLENYHILLFGYQNLPDSNSGRITKTRQSYVNARQI